MHPFSLRFQFSDLLCTDLPHAFARISGSRAYPGLSGIVRFYEPACGGLLIETECHNLPVPPAGNPFRFYGMHIHEYGSCGNDFADTGLHYNPAGQPHPYHLGDLLPVFGNDGCAWSAFYNRQLTLADIMGRSVIIHLQRDDFTSQPAGDSGIKIGCGVIRPIGRTDLI